MRQLFSSDRARKLSVPQPPAVPYDVLLHGVSLPSEEVGSEILRNARTLIVYAKNAITVGMPITGKDSLLAFPSKLKALLVLAVVRAVKVVPDKGFK